MTAVLLAFGAGIVAGVSLTVVGPWAYQKLIDTIKGL